MCGVKIKYSFINKCSLHDFQLVLLVVLLVQPNHEFIKNTIYFVLYTEYYNYSHLMLYIQMHRKMSSAQLLDYKGDDDDDEGGHGDDPALQMSIM